MSEHKCAGKVWDHMFYVKCGKTARYEHKGQWYCKTHHPPTVQEKLDARNKKWREDWEAKEQAMRKYDEARAEMERRAAAYDGLVAQRDALLEALKRVTTAQGFRSYETALQDARAAIKAVEGEKK